MTNIHFAANSFSYSLYYAYDKALFSKENEQSLVKLRSYKIRKRRKAV